MPFLLLLPKAVWAIGILGLLWAAEPLGEGLDGVSRACSVLHLLNEWAPGAWSAGEVLCTLLGPPALVLTLLVGSDWGPGARVIPVALTRLLLYFVGQSCPLPLRLQRTLVRRGEAAQWRLFLSASLR